MATDEVFDLSDFAAEFSGVEGARDRSEKFVPETGNYNVMITKTWLSKRESDDVTKPSQISLNWSLKILDGKHQGETIFKRNRLAKDPKQMRFLKTDLMTAGLVTDDINKLNDEAFRSQAHGTCMAVGVRVTDQEKGWYDVVFQRRLEV